MIENAQGLILRTRPLTETSLIVHWLTPDFGRIATVAKGARRSNSPFRGKLDLFYLADLSFARSRRSELHTLREVLLQETHVVLREELSCLRQASYCAALIEQATETDTPLPAIFELLTGLLGHLPSQPPQPLTILAFEMKLLSELGLRPDFEETKLSAGARQVLKKIAELDWPVIGRLKSGALQSREIQQFLHGFLVYHLGRLPKGRDAALAGPK
jgi:DNA repair protein RecO (recombination protein O)